MKKRLKGTFHVGTLVLGLLFILFTTSCNKEQTETPIEDDGLSISFKVGALDDFKSLGEFVENDIVTYGNNKKSKGSFSAKDSRGFTVISNDIVSIADSTGISYTLKIVKHDQPENSFSNLIVHFEDQQPPTATIINYYPSEAYLVNVENDPYTPFDGEVNMESVDYDGALNHLFSKTNCIHIDYYVCTYGGGENPVGSACFANPDGGEHVELRTVTVCWSTDTYTYEEPSPGEAGEPSPGGGSTPSTIPNYVPPCQQNVPGQGQGGVPPEYLGIEPGEECSDEVGITNVIINTLNLSLNSPEAQWLINDATDEQLVAISGFMAENTSSTGLVSTEAKEFSEDVIELYDSENWEQRLKDAIANGITSTAEVTHLIYKKLSDLAEKYPSSIVYINMLVNEFRAIANEVFDTDSQTLNWEDLFGIWLFELGSYSTISGVETIVFDNNDVTTTSLKQQEGVIEARQEALNKIANGNLTNPTISHPWVYGQGEFYDGMQNGNIATSFLGSYTTTIVINQYINGSYGLTFTVTNPSTWESATRLRIDNDGNGSHDGIFDNTNRNDPTTINLGGNLNQTWTWTEIIN